MKSGTIHKLVNIFYHICKVSACISKLVMECIWNPHFGKWEDWLIEQCFISPPTQYRLYGRRWGMGGRRGSAMVPLKQRRWFPIGFPLWPLCYLKPFGRNLPSNVSNAHINRGGSLWGKISGTRCKKILTWSWRDMGLSYAKEIMSISSATWGQCTKVTDNHRMVTSLPTGKITFSNVA